MTPVIPAVEHFVILPGNRRVRLFDFGRGTSRVHIKRGFDRGAIEAEVAVRGGGAVGPFVPITRHASDDAWFEEAIFDGYSLARCPPWFAGRRVAREAVKALEDWAEVGDALCAKDAAAELVGAIASMVEAMPHLAGLRVVATSERLAERVSSSVVVERSASHGDLQPGNVLVDRKGARVVLTDWEFHGQRIAHYDRLVLGLAARSPGGLASRLARFAHNEAVSPVLSSLPDNPGWRITRCALFGLEDIQWRLLNCQNVPYETVPTGLRTLVQELDELPALL
ncbi:MAG: phosphotransferase [Polyangiaceae bacterium]